MKSRIAQFITLILLVLINGVFWGTWFALSRSITDFSAAEFIHIGKVIIENVAMPMRVIFPLGILFLILSVLLYPQKKSAPFYLMVISFLLLIVTLLITLMVEVPIDNQIKEWTAATVPLNWETIRNRWEDFHTQRTFTSFASLGCFAAAIVFGNSFSIRSTVHKAKGQ